VPRPANNTRIYGVFYRHAALAKTSFIPDEISFCHQLPYLCPHIMKLHLAILALLTACLLVLPVSTVQACGDTTGIDWKSVSNQSNDEHCAATGDICQDTHPDEDCPPDTDGCGHCHCPGCGTVSMAYAGFFKNTPAEISALSRLFSDRAANFCYRAPSTSAHLAALFRPPISDYA
jgi:hypothetical protein